MDDPRYRGDYTTAFMDTFKMNDQNNISLYQIKATLFVWLFLFLIYLGKIAQYVLIVNR
jgi:hypothetical protein